MNDASAVLASLDRFIERFRQHDQLRDSHRVATQNELGATIKSLTNEGSDHSGHFGHSKQETSAGADPERCDSHPSAAENSGAGLARKVSYVDGYSGQSGNPVSNQGVAGIHPKSADGQSGNSSSDQDVASDLISIGNQRDDVVSSPADTCGSDSA